MMPSGTSWIMLLVCLAIAAGAVATRLLITWSPRRRRTNRPPLDEREQARLTIPRMGGIGVVAGAGAALAGLWALSPALAGRMPQPAPTGLLLGALLVFVAGLLDDIWSLSPRAKLVAQSVAGLLAVSGGFTIDALVLPNGDILQLGALAPALAIAWIILVVNAFNLIDGVDGLAGSLAAVIMLLVSAMGVASGRFDLVALPLATAGATLGFLRYNARGARVHLGDSGSMLLGYLLAVYAAEAGRTGPGAPILLLVPLLLLVVPLADTTVALARRWVRRVPVFRGDAGHIHHRLLARGLSEAAVVNVILGVAAASGALAAVVLETAQHPVALAAALLAGVALFHLATSVLGYHELVTAVRTARHWINGPGGWRLALRNEIGNEDLARAIRSAASTAEVAQTLECAVSQHGFLRMTFVDPRRPLILEAAGVDITEWHGGPGHGSLQVHHADEPLVAHRAERTAEVLGPACHAWASRAGHCEISATVRPELSNTVPGSAA
jgi:UDP-GlcNAc:undecaprenyl-phosphate/decaprenyl-phosphate GlcNAc-1-phosphate transferase